MSLYNATVIVINFLTSYYLCLDLKPDHRNISKTNTINQRSVKQGLLKPGQFINLPYYGARSVELLNIDGTFFTLEQFIKVDQMQTW